MSRITTRVKAARLLAAILAIAWFAGPSAAAERERGAAAGQSIYNPNTEVDLASEAAFLAAAEERAPAALRQLFGVDPALAVGDRDLAAAGEASLPRSPAELLLFPPTLLLDIDTGEKGDDDSDPNQFISDNGFTYFVADDDTRGNELWCTDGTTDGTRYFDLNPGERNSNPNNLVIVHGRLYFAANGPGGRELFHADCKTGYSDWYDLNESGGSNPSFLTDVNGRLAFSADNGADGRELWWYTEEDGLTQIDIYPGEDGSFPRHLTAIGGTAFFQANDGSTGPELWRSDGPAGASLVKDINPGGNGSTPQQLLNLDGILLFDAQTPDYGRELWRSLGTTGSTQLVKDINPEVDGSGMGIGSEIDMAPPKPGATSLFFSADDGVTGSELWTTNGTGAGTSLVMDIRPGPVGSDPDGFLTHCGLTFFAATTVESGREPWTTDGTTTGLLQDINTPGGSNPDNFTEVGAHVLFVANQGGSGRELWQTDGTDMGTELAFDLTAPNPALDPTDPDSSNPDNLYATGNGNLLFAADAGGYGNEPWILDGAINGDVHLDLGNAGIWRWLNDDGWNKMHPLPTNGTITCCDLDGNNICDPIIDFGDGVGIWYRENNKAWRRLHPFAAEDIVCCNLDFDETPDIVIDFGQGFGTWIRWNLSRWGRLSPVNAEDTECCDVDGDNWDDVFTDLGNQIGVWNWNLEDGWSRLIAPGNSPDSLACCNAYGCTEQLIIDGNVTPDFPGIWAYQGIDDKCGSCYPWTQLHEVDPAHIGCANLEHDEEKTVHQSDGPTNPSVHDPKEVVADFENLPPFGIWYLDDLHYGDWIPINPTGGQGFVACNVDDDSWRLDELIVDFGQNGAQILYNNDALGLGFQVLTPNDPGAMACCDSDGPWFP